jgi:hypothetical protein
MTNPSDRIEVFPSVQWCQRWSASEKVRIAEETLIPA